MNIAKAMRALATRPEVAALLAHWQAGAPGVAAEAETIQQIAAPTFAEAERGSYTARRLSALGAVDIDRDAVGNIYGRLPGRQTGPGVLLSAHLDTVFPADTDLSLTHSPGGRQISGPGIGDNSLGVAAILALSAALRERAIGLPADLWVVATTGEEGLGDLRGMRAACDRLSGRIGLAVIVEGMGLGRVYDAGLAVRRLEVAAEGPGGHSWLQASAPSAIHALLPIGAALVERIVPPATPRSSFNIGLIRGGMSINTRAAQASLAIDLRSEDSRALSALENAVRTIISGQAIPAGVEVETRVIGDRPGGALPAGHPLAQAALCALELTGGGPGRREIGSTDANIPLARGIPAVCVGITTGSGAHTLQESIDTGPIAAGMRQLSLLTLAALEHAAAWSSWEV